METLFVLEQHRNQYYSRNKLHISDGVSSSPSRSFREINCRTFQSGDGILPSPLCVHSVKTSQSFTTPRKENNKENNDNICRKSTSAIPIKSKPADIESPFNCYSSASFSELWAGPAYSNSPPPSSLPIPKFSLRPKRSVSLDSPIPVHGFTIHPVAKSAPPSPSRETGSSSLSNFFLNTAATENLRRILHLDVTDD